MGAPRNVRLLQACYFIFYFLPHAPVAILFFQGITGSFSLAMAVFATERAAAIAFEVPTGVLSDLAGRKGTLLLGIGAKCIGYALFAVAQTPQPLFAGAISVGLSIALCSGNNDALLYDSLQEDGREDEYPHHYGRMYAMLQAGLASSALVGGLLAMRSVRLAFIFAVPPQVLAFALALAIREPRVHGDRIRPNIFAFLRGAGARFQANPFLRTFALGSVLTQGVTQSLFVYAPAFFALLWPLWAIGLARSMASAAAALSYWFAGHFLKKTEPLKVLAGGHLIVRTVNLIAYGIPTVLSPLLASLMSFFYGIRDVAENSTMQRHFTDAERATLGSMVSFLSNLLLVVMAGIVGMLADALGPATALLIGELFFLPAIVLYASLLLRSRRTAA